MKVEINIIISIAVSLIERVVAIVIMYVESFKTIVFISKVIICLMSN